MKRKKEEAVIKSNEKQKKKQYAMQGRLDVMTSTVIAESRAVNCLSVFHNQKGNHLIIFLLHDLTQTRNRKNKYREKFCEI